MAGDGRFVVTWESNNQDGNGRVIYRQEYTAAGALDGGELPGQHDHERQPEILRGRDGRQRRICGRLERRRAPGDSDGVWERRFAAATAGRSPGRSTTTSTATGTSPARRRSPARRSTCFVTSVSARSTSSTCFRRRPSLPRPARTASPGSGPAPTTSSSIRERSARPTPGPSRPTEARGRRSAPPSPRPTARCLAGASASGRHFGRCDHPQSRHRRAHHKGDLDRRRRRRRSGLRIQLQRDNHRARRRRRRPQRGPHDPGLAPPVHPERERHHRRAGGGLLDRRRRAAVDRFAGGMPATVTDAVVLDAATQEGVSTTPRIELNGTSAGAVSGLTLAGTGGSTVRGFVINRFTGNGILVSPNSNGNQILGNWIGIDAHRRADQGNNGDGIHLRGNGNLVSGNVISGNQNDGIEIEAGRSDNRITANYIGTNSAGTGAIANNANGVNVPAATTRLAAPPAAKATSSRATASPASRSVPHRRPATSFRATSSAPMLRDAPGRQRHRRADLGRRDGEPDRRHRPQRRQHDCVQQPGRGAGHRDGHDRQHDLRQCVPPEHPTGNRPGGRRRRNPRGRDAQRRRRRSGSGSQRLPELPATPRGGDQRRQPQRPIQLRQHRDPQLPDRALRLERAGRERLRRGAALSRLGHRLDR